MASQESSALAGRLVPAGIGISRPSCGAMMPKSKVSAMRSKPRLIPGAHFAVAGPANRSVPAPVCLACVAGRQGRVLLLSGGGCGFPVSRDGSSCGQCQVDREEHCERSAQ